MDPKYQVINFDPEYSSDFARLNYRWIEEYFKIEDADRLYLDNPEKMIIDKGGDIIFIKEGNRVVGTCALVKMDDKNYELAKMAIDPSCQGEGLGYVLGKAVVSRAKELGANRLFLESNTILAPAINLYEKLGFKRMEIVDSPYERCNIQMEYWLD